VAEELKKALDQVVSSLSAESDAIVVPAPLSVIADYQTMSKTRIEEELQRPQVDWLAQQRNAVSASAMLQDWPGLADCADRL